MADDNPEPPCFILLSQSNLPGLSSTNPPATTFVHPVIEYHFADDPPTALLPSSLTETVIILDYDGSDANPQARSLEKDIIVTGVNVTEALGNNAVRDGEPKRNDRIYIIETIGGADGR